MLSSTTQVRRYVRTYVCIQSIRQGVEANCAQYAITLSVQQESKYLRTYTYRVFFVRFCSLTYG